MYRNHREAFAQKKGSKRPVETNLDSIINQAQIKMKEMIAEKQETDKKTNLLIGQENVLNENINFLKVSQIEKDCCSFDFSDAFIFKDLDSFWLLLSSLFASFSSSSSFSNFKCSK